MNTLIHLCMWLLFLCIHYVHGQVGNDISFYVAIKETLGVACYTTHQVVAVNYLYDVWVYTRLRC